MNLKYKYVWRHCLLTIRTHNIYGNSYAANYYFDFFFVQVVTSQTKQKQVLKHVI